MVTMRGTCACNRSLDISCLAAGEIGFLARMGEDEFAILLQGHTHRSVCFVLERIKASVLQTVTLQATYASAFTASIGVAIRCDGQRFNPDEFIRRRITGTGRS